MNRVLRLLPILMLLMIVGALVWRLANPEDTVVHSKLIGRSLPDVAIGAMVPEGPAIPLRSLRGEPVAINFFASWCVPCIAEAPLLDRLRQQGVPIIGIAVRDRPDDVGAFLARNGNPYRTIGRDPESQVQIALGSSGVPETFLVDGGGIIRYQHVGPIEREDLASLLREWEALRQ